MAPKESARSPQWCHFLQNLSPFHCTVSHVRRERGEAEPSRGGSALHGGSAREVAARTARAPAAREEGSVRGGREVR